MGSTPRIGDYAVIGDGRSAALVSKAGSIDWLCWPRFDSPSLFAALLDAQSGGHFSIRPTGIFKAQRRYLGDSNVLCTRFATPRGRGRLIDLMPVTSEEAKRTELQPEHEVLRSFECELGELELEVVFEPRPDYGKSPAHLESRGPLGLRIENGVGLYTLRSDVPLALVGERSARAVVTLKAGQRVTFSLTYAHEGPTVYTPLAERGPLAISRSVWWWQRWSSHCTYVGPYRAQVLRSLLALKLLSYAPSGAIVAAPTTSLPEVVGGAHNWDYRFCWLRDASLTISALHDLGYQHEAIAFLNWLLHATALSRPQLDVLYDVYGRLPAREKVLGHLRGYLGSRPVRINNGALHQEQLDVYGEVIDAVAHMVRRGVRLSGDSRKMLRGLATYVMEHWRDPDQGIWEPRHAPSRHTHSLVTCWAAAERLLELNRHGVLPGIDVARLKASRDTMKHVLHTRAWNEKLGAYTRELDGDQVDASLLLMSWYGFEHASSARQRSTLARIRQRLEVKPGLLKRWENAPDGAFGICSFWAVQHLAEGSGSLAEAEQRFKWLLAYANDVGLYGEETEPSNGEALGNFPQAFTHIGLIQAALAIERRRAGQQLQRKAA
ncbi:MAG: glycoside hydrolase family 15 protein [Archangiaceae bacterium]|nr:glycoside hydrolase family 15 protein [Archangiaceae bacterium]